MDAPTAELTAIAPGSARYIKLGTGNRRAERCLSQGDLPLLYVRVPHEPCAAGDWAEVARILAYLIWLRAVWRCSRNVERALWTYLARVAAILGLVANAVLY